MNHVVSLKSLNESEAKKQKTTKQCLNGDKQLAGIIEHRRMGGFKSYTEIYHALGSIHPKGYLTRY